MTQNEKDLLLKDLCVRLPYGVKIQAKYNPINIDANVEIEKVGVLSMVDNDAVIAFACDDTNTYNYVTIHDVKPYLFPLSSMTDELWDKEFRGYSITEDTRDSFKYGCETLEFYDYNPNPNLSSMVGFINQLIKNHFDIYGLIPKGLAIDATNLNIY
jgi:hypothetical protein